MWVSESIGLASKRRRLRALCAICLSMDTLERAICYVYVKFRENGTPFYVGKGSTKGRWLEHERDARRGVKGHRFAIIRSMQARGLEVPTVKIHTNLTEAQANEYEIALIAAIGRLDLGTGPLVNLTNGGDGGGGRQHSPETIAKWAAAGRNISPETRAKRSEALRGRQFSPETIAKWSATRRGRKQSPEHVAKTAAVQRSRKHSLEHNTKVAASLRGKKLSLETRAKKSAALLGRPLSPDHVEKLRARPPEVYAKAWATRRANQAVRTAA